MTQRRTVLGCTFSSFAALSMVRSFGFGTNDSSPRFILYHSILETEVGKQEYWDRELEERLLARLPGRDAAGGPKPIVLVYTRQSVSDFDEKGEPVGPSLSQQLDTVLRLSDLQGLEFEHHQDADRSGKETSRRPGYLSMIERIRTAVPGAIGAVGFYDQDRLHRNDMEFNLFMAEMAERRILVFDATGLISHAQKLPWKIKA